MKCHLTVKSVGNGKSSIDIQCNKCGMGAPLADDPLIVEDKLLNAPGAITQLVGPLLRDMNIHCPEQEDNAYEIEI